MPEYQRLAEQIDAEGGEFCKSTRNRQTTQRAVAYVVLALIVICAGGWAAYGSLRLAAVSHLDLKGDKTRTMAHDNREAVVELKADLKHVMSEQKTQSAQLDRIEDLVRNLP